MKKWVLLLLLPFCSAVHCQQSDAYKLILSVFNKKSKEPIKDVTVEIINLENNHRDTIVTTEKIYYTVYLEENSDYYIHTLPHYKKFQEVSTYTSTKEKAKGLMLFKSIEIDVPMQVVYSIKVENIFFDKNSYKLTDEAKYELDKLILIMKNNPTFEVEFTSYCDCKENNTILIAYRNYAVFEFLKENGLERKRMRVNNLINSIPEICKKDGCNETTQKQSRKTEFKVLKF